MQVQHSDGRCWGSCMQDTVYCSDHIDMPVPAFVLIGWWDTEQGAS